MKYEIQRTSLGCVEKPCKEAKSLYVKTSKSKIWFVEIKSLKDLMDFKKKYGGLIIRDSIYEEMAACIEIYDGYRE